MESTSTTVILEEKDCAAPNRLGPTIIFIIRGIYGVLSIFLYFVNISAMRRSKISKIFFVLYSTCALMSCIFFIEYWIVKQFLDLGYWCHFFLRFFYQPNWTLAATRIISTYCPISILVCYFLISLHRMVAVIHPTKMKKWDQHITKLLIISLFIPFFFMWFVIPCKGFLVNDPVSGLDIEYTRLAEGPFCSFSSTLFSVIASVIFGFLTLLNTVIMTFVLKTKSVNVPDFGLVYFEILMAVVTLLYAATQASLYLLHYVHFDQNLKYQVEIVRTFVVDVFILPQSWTLLIFCRTVRNSAKRMFLPKKSSVPPPTPFKHSTVVPWGPQGDLSHINIKIT